MKNTSKYKGIIIKELKSKGFVYQDANEIFKQKKLEPTEVNIILKWLPNVYTENYGTADILVRSLISAVEPFDPFTLMDLFDNWPLNFSLKSGIAVVLVSAKTTDISEWMKDQLLNKEFALERLSLIEGLPKKCGFTTEIELMEFLQQIFYKYHDEDVEKYFKKYGRAEDAMFLRKEIRKLDNKYHRRFEKVIKAIEDKTIKK